MNIGIVTTWFERGAAYVSRMYKDLLCEDHNVFIYARGGETYAKNDEYWDKDYVTWGKKAAVPFVMGISYNEFKHWVQKNNIEVVFFNEQHWWEPVKWCKNLGVISGAYVDYYTERTIPFFEIYDFLICNTKRHYEIFKWHHDAYYVPWGTDTNVFLCDSFNLVNSDYVTFFHSAGYSPARKGTDLVIRAFAELAGEAIRLMIHTQVKLREIFPNLKNLIDKLQKEYRLILIEKTVSAPGVYHMGDIYVYPSRLDGIGLTIAEALASGLPVIASNNAPMNEFINDDNGKLVTIAKYFSRSDGYYWPQCEVDLSSLIKEMQWYLKRRDKLVQYKKAARDFAEKNLCWFNNRQLLKNIFSAVRNMPKSKISNIDVAIKLYEKSNGLWARLYYDHPYLFKVLNAIRRLRRLISRG